MRGLRDVVPAVESLGVFFDPLVLSADEVTRAVRHGVEAAMAIEELPPIEIPVEYGGEAGPDLDEVAAASNLSAADVVARHAGRDYRVEMVGFLPGFAYLGPVDGAIVASRRPSPRPRVPPGSVAVAGGRTGVYPQASPGGWRLIGRTTVHPFDAARTPPALLAPGQRVRFVVVAPGSLGSFGDAWARRSAERTRPARRAVAIVQPGLMTTVQDGGRWGHQHDGVPVSGAMDLPSLRAANRAVGNEPGAAALEVTLAGLEVKVEQPATLAIAGADLAAALDGEAVPLEVPVRCRAGSVLRLRARVAGARAYVAFDGGIDVDPCLGSRATDLASGLGGWDGRRLRAGDRLPLGAPGTRAPERAESRPSAGPVPGGYVRVRVLPGPHDDWFPPDALDALARTRFEVTTDSNRMGYRLRTPRPLPRRTGDLISAATWTGAIQVPPSGEPILLMADRQVTGGYPIVATVISADLGLVGQLAPGDGIEFALCEPAEALAALAERGHGSAVA
jgi:KipI family sensor histidine kinase inhibitor